MDDKSSVFAILVNYNTPLLTQECIDSLKKSTYQNIHIIVVDNGSIDDSSVQLSKVGGIVFLHSNQNLGFSGGNNIGIKYALEHDADYIMLLNNDTIIDPNMVRILLENNNGENITIPKIYYFPKGNKHIWAAGGELVKFDSDAIQRGLNELDNGQYNSASNISFCCGCCFLTSAQIWKKIGLLREEYFLYCEDTDFSVRLKQNDVKVRYIPEAVMWHKVSASSGGENSKFIAYYVTRNRLYLAVVNHLGMKAVLAVLIQSIGRYIKSFFKSNKSYRIVPFALFDEVKGNMGKSGRNLRK